MRERESLFNEYLLEVRKREKEEKTAKREQVFLFYFLTPLRILLCDNATDIFQDMHYNMNE